MRIVFLLRKPKFAEENVIYMYITGGEKPDFGTICNFKIFAMAFL